MYVATMEYALSPGSSAAEAARLWKLVVLEGAKGREGLVRLQLLGRPESLLAIGTWQDKRFAEAFMQTGVFVRLKEALAPFLAGEPQPRLWTEEASVSP